MFEKKTVGILGAGNMGQALMRGFLNSGLLGPDQIIASARSTATLDALREGFGVTTTLNNRELVEKADIVLVGTKPYSVVPVLSEVASALRERQMLISVAAGLRTDVIEAALSLSLPVIRVMPNTPSLIGLGANAFCPGRYAEAGDIARVKALLESTGMAIQVSDDQMDSVTAISGSGPAYVFLFMEAFYDAAIGLGLAPDRAHALVNQTMRGAVELACTSEDTPSVLRRKVTSPGGVTAEAIAAFEAGDFRGIIKRAIQAGHDRSAEMTRVCDGESR